MNLFLNKFLLICCLILGQAFARPIPFHKNLKEVKVKHALGTMTCQPLTITNTGPVPTASQKSKIGDALTIALGAYKFIRTDVGDPDGILKVYLKNKLICEVEISILTGIKIEPKRNILLLKWSSGSGSNWEIFETGKVCKSLGLVSDSNTDVFEAELDKLKSCD